MAVGTVPASQPPRLRPSLWTLFWECDTLPDAYLLLIVCCVCAFASLPFAEEVICKSLLSASLRGRDKLHERLWRLACLISFTDKLECTFVINTRSSLADSITPKLAGTWLPQRMIGVISPAFPFLFLLLFSLKFYPFFYHYHLKIHTEQICQAFCRAASNAEGFY